MLLSLLLEGYEMKLTHHDRLFSQSSLNGSSVLIF